MADRLKKIADKWQPKAETEDDRLTNVTKKWVAQQHKGSRVHRIGPAPPWAAAMPNLIAEDFEPKGMIPTPFGVMPISTAKKIVERAGLSVRPGEKPTIAGTALKALFAPVSLPFSALGVQTDEALKAVGIDPETRHKKVDPTITERLLGLEKGTVGEFAELGTMFFGGVPGRLSKAAKVSATARAMDTPRAAGIIRDYAHALKTGRGREVSLGAEAALKEIGVPASVAPDLLRMNKATIAVDVLEDFRWARATNKAGDISYESRAAEEAARDILRSFGLEGKQAENTLIQMAKADSTAELWTAMSRGALSKEMANLPIPEAVSKSMGEIFSWVSTPAGVMETEPVGLAAFRVLQDAKHNWTHVQSRMIEKYNKISNQMTKQQKFLTSKILNGEFPPGVGKAPNGMYTLEAASEVPRASVDAANFIRRNILTPMARLRWKVPGGKEYKSLPEQGRFIEDYFTHFFDKWGSPKDIIGDMAKRTATKQGKVWDMMADAERGKFLEGASKQMRREVKEIFSGPISASRTRLDPHTRIYDLDEVIPRYIVGGWKKYYLDKSIDRLHSLYPKMSQGMREYTLALVDHLRGVPGNTEVITNAGLTSLIEGLEATGTGGKAMAKFVKGLTGGGTAKGMAGMMKMIQADAKLGWNFLSPLINLSQTSVNTYTKVGLRTLKEAIKLRSTPKGQRLISKSGVTSEVPKHELVPEELLSMPKFAKMSDVLLTMFNWSERTNREIAYLAGYIRARKAKPAANWKAFDQAGRNLVMETQFDFSVLGRPQAIRGPLGSLMGQFKLFPINQVRFIKNLKGKEWARFALSTALHGGLKGIPGTQTLMKLIIGYQVVQRVKDSELPNFVKRAVIGGPFGAVTGVSLEEDVGLAFLPSSAKEMVPPFLGLATTSPEDMKKAWKGDPISRERILRELIRNMPAGVQAERFRQAYLAMKRGGMKLDAFGNIARELTPVEMLQEGMFGGKAITAIEGQEIREFMEKTSESFVIAREQLQQEVIKGMLEKDAARIQRAIDKAEADGIVSADLSEIMVPALVRRYLSLPFPAKQQIMEEYPEFIETMERQLEIMDMSGDVDR